MTQFQPPFDQRMQTDMSALFKRVATLEQQMVQATSNVASGPVASPLVNGLLAWTLDIAETASTGTASFGVVNYTAIVLPTAATVTNIVVNVSSAGSGLLSTENFAGIYDSSGVRQAVTVDQASAWGSIGSKTCVLTAPVALVAGLYYVAVLTNGITTPPSFTVAPSSPGSRFGRPSAPFRGNSGGSGLTALPATVTLTGLASDNIYASGLN